MEKLNNTLNSKIESILFKGTFGSIEASKLIKEISNSGFFEAGHAIKLNGLENLITTIKLSNHKNTYFVNGYEFTGDGWLLHTGELKYAAGNYVIYKMYLKKFVKKLKQ